jgi:type I protein arginine methyltransferase
MYSLKGFEEMIDDGVRMAAYSAALRSVISPTSVVVDVGAGTGIMSLLACQFGAKRVYAIEPNDAVVVARQNAIANGMGDRITFIQGMSTEVAPPEKADVVVADLRGILPLFRSNIDSLIHAREHLVKPGGVLIPKRDRLWMAVVTNPNSTSGAKGWNRNDCGLSLSAASQYLANTTRKQRQSIDDLLTAPVCWATLDYATIESPHVESSVDLEASCSGTAAGISMWFETILWGDIGFSNGPGNEQAIYGMLFFPLAQTVDVEKGDSIRVAVKARHHEGDYLWQWDTTIRSKKTDKVLASFQQSSFYATPLVSDRLRKSADRFLPNLSDDGRVTRFILGLMDGTRDNGVIAAAVVREFPTRFSDVQSALTRVGQVCLQFC